MAKAKKTIRQRYSVEEARKIVVDDLKAKGKPFCETKWCVAVSEIPTFISRPGHRLLKAELESLKRTMASCCNMPMCNCDGFVAGGVGGNCASCDHSEADHTC